MCALWLVHKEHSRGVQFEQVNKKNVLPLKKQSCVSFPTKDLICDAFMYGSLLLNRYDRSVFDRFVASAIILNRIDR